jgi:hypothetical protein
MPATVGKYYLRDTFADQLDDGFVCSVQETACLTVKTLGTRSINSNTGSDY